MEFRLVSGADGLGTAVTLIDSAGEFAVPARVPLRSYVFLADGAGQTAQGFYVDANGNRTGVSFSLALNAWDGNADALPFPAPPADAVGAIVKFDGRTFYDISGATSDDFEDNATRYPEFGPADGCKFFGLVNA